jgi:hypothetical protein
MGSKRGGGGVPEEEEWRSCADYEEDGIEVWQEPETG